MRKLEHIIEITGYLAGSPLLPKDAIKLEGCELFFENILNGIIQRKGYPIFNTYRVIEYQDVILAVMLIDASDMDNKDVKNIPILEIEG